MTLVLNLMIGVSTYFLTHTHTLQFYVVFKTCIVNVMSNTGVLRVACDVWRLYIHNVKKTRVLTRSPALPQAAFTNDMMMYCAPTELYKLNATVMETICASVCITYMICFTLGTTFRTHRSTDEQAHANL